MIYEYAVLLKPKSNEIKKAEIIVPVTAVVAGSEKEATMIAIRAIPPQFAEFTDRLEVAVRTF